MTEEKDGAYDLDNQEQLALFDVDEWWREHWVGMPEFEQESTEPIKTITISFRNKQDLDAFCTLVKQKITPDTQYIFYPSVKRERIRHVYADGDTNNT